ncbi:MAG: hypothetical protein MZV64_43180 [Ignavibacteriales bacterium]|nr:hypothetical protein [Ignavibacteriales bacterium]
MGGGAPDQGEARHRPRSPSSRRCRCATRRRSTPRRAAYRRPRASCAAPIPASPSTASRAAGRTPRCSFGIEELILETYDDPAWVHGAARRSCATASCAFVALDGGRAVRPARTGRRRRLVDRHLAEDLRPTSSRRSTRRSIAAAHEAGQRIVYHTCGGMMPLLERIAGMEPDAMETFTPTDMGGDARPGRGQARASASRVCMIGGFDQFHYFTGCTPEETRARGARRCFDAGRRAAAGSSSAPSDHFFDADDALLRAFADEARAADIGSDPGSVPAE